MPGVWAEGRQATAAGPRREREGSRQAWLPNPPPAPGGPRAGSWLCSATWGLEGSCGWKVTPGPRRNHRHINHWLSVAAVLFSAHSGPGDPHSPAGEVGGGSEVSLHLHPALTEAISSPRVKPTLARVTFWQEGVLIGPWERGSPGPGPGRAGGAAVCRVLLRPTPAPLLCTAPPPCRAGVWAQRPSSRSIS